MPPDRKRPVPDERQRWTAARRREVGNQDAVEQRFVARMVLARKHRNLTAVQLAQRIHELGGPLYDRATISRIETGHRTVTLAEAWLIAQALALPFVAMCNPEPMLVETRVEIP